MPPPFLKHCILSINNVPSFWGALHFLWTISYLKYCRIIYWSFRLLLSPIVQQGYFRRFRPTSEARFCAATCSSAPSRPFYQRGNQARSPVACELQVCCQDQAISTDQR